MHDEEQLVDISDRFSVMQMALASMNQILSPFMLPTRQKLVTCRLYEDGGKLSYAKIQTYIAKNVACSHETSIWGGWYPPDIGRRLRYLGKQSV